MNMRNQPDPKQRPGRSRTDSIVYTVFALILIALAIDGVFGPHGFIVTYRLKLQVQQARQKTQELEQENHQFTDQVQQLKSDPSAIEQVAREKMGLVKPGQLVFKLPPKSSSSSGASSSGRADRTTPSGSSTH